MSIENKKKLLVKFPEANLGTPVQTPINATPNNPVDKAADFLPRALTAIKENFKEAIFLFGILGYIFIAAFGHIEKIRNYIGYFFVMAVGIIFYKIWEKILLRDVIYMIIIFLLGSYVIFLEFGNKIINWIK